MRFVIEVPKAVARKTYVGTPHDGGWRTYFLDEVRTWKTRRGAERWMADRPGTEVGAVIKVAKVGRNGKVVEVLG